MSIDIGVRIRQIRMNAKLNQRDFASRLRISTGGISQIESGKVMPGGDFLLRIHQEFNVDITYLLTGEYALRELSKYGTINNADEAQILTEYRKSSNEARDAARYILKKMSGKAR